MSTALLLGVIAASSPALAKRSAKQNISDKRKATATKPIFIGKAFMKSTTQKTAVNLALKHTKEHNTLLDLAFEDFAEESAYTGSRGAVTLKAPEGAGKVQKMLWFHGAEQIPNNLIIRRLARAFAHEGLAFEIVSMPYRTDEERQAISQFIEEQKEPILVGGHSMGTGPASHFASFEHPMIKGAILLNGDDGYRSVIPTLQLKGSVMDGPAQSNNPKVTPVQVVGADHSLRYHAEDRSEPRDKNDQNRSVGTWQLNLLVAKQVKSFVEGL